MGTAESLWKKKYQNHKQTALETFRPQAEQPQGKARLVRSLAQVVARVRSSVGELIRQSPRELMRKVIRNEVCRPLGGKGCRQRRR